MREGLGGRTAGLRRGVGRGKSDKRAGIYTCGYGKAVEKWREQLLGSGSLERHATRGRESRPGEGGGGEMEGAHTTSLGESWRASGQAPRQGGEQGG